MSRHLAKLLEVHLKAYVTDPQVTEISLNTDGRLWVEKAGDNHMVDAGQSIDAGTARNICQDLAGDSALSEKTPLAGSDFEAFDSLWRTQVVLNPVVENGPVFTLRRNVVQNFTLDQLCAGLERSDLDEMFGEKENPADAAVMEAYRAHDVSGFLHLAAQAKWNILFSGGTSSGKTTWLRATLANVAAAERILCIEDVRDIHASQPNSLSMKTSSKVTSTDLLKASLRLRPDRVMLGELRGAEAFDFLNAINSGHSGGISTLHANSPDGAIERLAMMVMQADVSLQRQEIIEYCRSMIDVVIQLHKVGSKRKPTAIKIYRKGLETT